MLFFRQFVSTMKKHLLLLLAISAIQSQAQIDSESCEILLERVRSVQPFDTIHYARTPQQSLLSSSLDYLKNYPRHRKHDSLKLTRAERIYIYREMKKKSRIDLPADLFPLSRMMKTDSIIGQIETTVWTTFDSIRKESDLLAAEWARLHFHTWAYFFTRPVFIRNNTVCVFYFMYYLLSSGQDGIECYQKRNGKWKRVLTIGGGAW